ncbi:MAG: photosystem II cytochrome c-550 [Cyanobacterium sp.]
MKRFFLIILAGMFLMWQSFTGTANALSLSEELRTVPLNDQGDLITLSNQETQLGSQLFVASCTQCHIQGKTKTNPNVGLSLEALANAVPARDNVLALVDYMKYPTTYDGEDDLSLLHMNTDRTDIWSEMRNYTDDDLEAIAGYILIQTKADPKWGKRTLIEP